MKEDLSRRMIDCQMTLPRTDAENPCQILPTTTTEHCILWNYAPRSKQAEDNSQILSGGNMSQYFDGEVPAQPAGDIHLPTVR